MNVGAIVTGVINHILRDLMYYPRQLVIPLVDDVDVERLTTPPCLGMLYVTILSGKNLR
jgi:hypothetical protein